MLAGLGSQDDRGNLLRYLDDPRIDPTNYKSEHELRGGVRARVVSHGSKNERGAKSHGIMLSVMRTLRKRCGANAIEQGLLNLFNSGNMPPRLPPQPTTQ